LIAYDQWRKRLSTFLNMSDRSIDQAIIPVFYPIFHYAAKKGLTVTHRPDRRFNAGMIRPVAKQSARIRQTCRSHSGSAVALRRLR
jgi:hypothetical protein